jgi:PPP family 3-phenylpropionic acid transporter
MGRGFLSLSYFFALGALGAIVPFLGGRLEAAGLDGGTIGLLMAMLPLGRILSSPVWGWVADRYRMAGVLLRLGCGMALVGELLLLASGHAGGPVLAAVGLFVFATGRVPLGPLVDTVILDHLRAVGRDPREYGSIRLWGSVGFLGVAACAAWMSDSGRDPLILGAVLLTVTMGFAFAFPTRGGGGPAPIGPALAALAREPFLVPLLLTAALQALALSVYDTFFSVHVQALGLPASATAAALALGVTGEIVVMRFASPILRRLGAANALLVAALVGTLRWGLTAALADPVALVAVQALHAVSFGFFWLAGVQMMAERAPVSVSASAQSLFSAASYGVGALGGALLAGEMRARFGSVAIFQALTLVSVGSVVSAAWLVRRTRTPQT